MFLKFSFALEMSPSEELKQTIRYPCDASSFFRWLPMKPDEPVIRILPFITSWRYSLNLIIGPFLKSLGILPLFLRPFWRLIFWTASHLFISMIPKSGDTRNASDSSSRMSLGRSRFWEVPRRKDFRMPFVKLSPADAFLVMSSSGPGEAVWSYASHKIKKLKF